MPSSCCAIGCTNRGSKENGIRLYRFPKDAERRRLWARVLKRELWEPSEHSRICGGHFISGCSLVVQATRNSVWDCRCVLLQLQMYAVSEIK